MKVTQQMLRFILEKETWLPVAQKDGQPRDRTELSPSCLVLSGRQGPRAPTCGGGRAGPRRGEPRPFSHSSPLGTQLSRRPTEKRGGASRPVASEPAWGTGDCRRALGRGPWRGHRAFPYFWAGVTLIKARPRGLWPFVVVSSTSWKLPQNFPGSENASAGLDSPTAQHSGG